MASVTLLNWIAILALCLLGHSALAQERPVPNAESLRATAIEAAQITAIKNRCPPHIGVDVGFAADLQRAFIADGIRQIGKEPFVEMVKTEQARVRAAIEAGDLAAWCRRQKALLEKPYPDMFRP